jgi:hypothetical protein
MATQLLIYESAVPVSSARHGNWSIEAGGDFAFSKAVNSVPLMAVEFPHACPEYPIVFAGSGKNMVPAVIIGLRGDENLFLTGEGGWDAKYVPAFIRRYPFVFSTSEDGNTFTLCIDESFPGFNQDGRGERLFAEDGKPTAYVERVLDFLKEYQLQFRRTQLFCEKLAKLELLEPMQAQVTTGAGEKSSLTGFMAVSREKLKGLSGEALAELAKTDELELLYLHLQSMRNFNALKDRMSSAAAGRGTDPAAKGKGTKAQARAEAAEGT